MPPLEWLKCIKWSVYFITKCVFFLITRTHLVWNLVKRCAISFIWSQSSHPILSIYMVKNPFTNISNWINIYNSVTPCLKCQNITKLFCFLSLNDKIVKKFEYFFSNFHAKWHRVTQKIKTSVMRYLACCMYFSHSGKGHPKNI